jgi:cation-transporting ATPase 13A1
LTLIYLSNYVFTIEPYVSCILLAVSPTNSAHRRNPDVDLEGDFQPSLLNSAVYLLQLIQQISTFAINYQGRPFRESISENRGMYWGMILVTGVAFSCSTEFIPEINEKMKLVPFSNAFKLVMTTTMVADYLGCWVVEKVLKNMFSDYQPKDIAVRRPDQLAFEEKRKLEEKEAAIKLLSGIEGFIGLVE